LVAVLKRRQPANSVTSKTSCRFVRRKMRDVPSVLKLRTWSVMKQRAGLLGVDT
jgi:hypothetical protein